MSKGKKTMTRELKAPGETELFEAIKDHMSPEALAAMASYLDTASTTVGTNNPDVNNQVEWFARKLRELLGGDEQHSRLCKEIGL